MGLVARAGGVLAAVGAVVVGPVARPVVVVVVALEERVVRRTVGETTADAHTAAAVAISDEGVSLLRTATERHGDGVALRVAAAHRLAPPVLSHDNSSSGVGRRNKLSAELCVDLTQANTHCES